jgi:predicted CoA-binding protein
MNDKEVEEILSNSKVIAMVGVSSLKKEENPKMIKRRPSTIVMKYMQEFGYKVIPVNPFAVGEKIHGETVIDNLENIKIPIDIVNIFRSSKETPILANQAVKIRTKVLWLQYGIQNEEAKKIATKANISYVENRCIKQEYQKIFQKMSPVFPALKL